MTPTFCVRTLLPIISLARISEANCNCCSTISHFSSPPRLRPRNYVSSIRRSALSPTAVRLLTQWLTSNLMDLVSASQEGALFAAIIDQVLQHTSNDAVMSLSNPGAAAEVARLWMDGRPFAELFSVLQQGDVRVGARRVRPKVENVVEICEVRLRLRRSYAGEHDGRPRGTIERRAFCCTLRNS